MLKNFYAFCLILLTCFHPKVEKSKFTVSKNLSTAKSHIPWTPKEMHKRWIEDSLNVDVPKLPWKIQWEIQPLHHKIAGITRLIGERHILIDLNPMYRYEWDHVYMHELVHAAQIQEGRLTIIDDLWYWDGELCDWTIPWDERPWEIDAEARTRAMIIQNSKNNGDTYRNK